MADRTLRMCVDLLLSALALAAETQPPAVLWDKTFLNDACCQALRETGEGDLVMAGTLWCPRSDPGNRYPCKFYIAKTDPQGNQRWERTFTPETGDGGEGYSLCLGQDETYVMGGNSSNYGLAILKISADGDLIWMRDDYRDGLRFIRGLVAPTSDGCYLLLGGTAEAIGYVAKIDGNGNRVWEKQFLGSLPPWPDVDLFSIASQPDGGFVVGGSQLKDPGLWQGYLAGLDMAGEVMWERNLGAERINKYVWSLRHTSEGGFVVGGERMWVKIDTQGQVTWLKDSSPALAEVMCIEQTANSGYIAAGSTTETNAIWDCWRGRASRVAKLDDKAEIVWQKDFEAGLGEAVIQTKDGGYVVLGGATSSDGNAYGYRLMKLAPDSPPASFRRGRTNGDDAVNVADAICLLGYLFGPAADPCKQTVAQCLDAGDTNDDGRLNISDAIMLLRHVFSAAALPAPFEACGADETADAVGCVSFPACE